MSPTLISYLGIPGYTLLWIATVVAFGMFGYRMYFWYRTLRLGAKEDRFQNFSKRLMRFVVDIFVQPRFNDGIMWPVHLAIFWGFVFYAITFFLSLLKGLLPFIPYPMPDQIPWVRVVLEIWSVLVLIALAIAAIRRFFIKPEGLKQSRDAAFILSMIAMLMLTSLVGSASEAAAGEHAVTPSLGIILGDLLRGFGILPATATSLSVGMWWMHMLLVLGFLAYLPFSKHLHLLLSPFGVYFTDLAPKGRMINQDLEKLGAPNFDLRDFTWRELLTPLACAECGRCDRSCPAYHMKESYSPQTIVHSLKEHLLEAAPFILRGSKEANGHLKYIGKQLESENVWGCTSCYSCVERCPVRNEHLPIIMRARRYLVGNGMIDEAVQDTLTSFTRYGNSFNQSDRNRAKWTQGLSFKIKDARKEEVDYLWFLGDYAAFDPRVQNITRTVANIFHTAGIDFGILYESERNSGNDVRRIGEEGLFEMLAEKNIAVLGKSKFQRIVTTDPHTYNTLRNEYPDFGARYDVVHYTEVLERLLRNNAVSITSPINRRVTYHDPCYLGRYNNIYEQPRRILRAIGADLIEMPRNKADGYCCGAGGGRIWMEDKGAIKERPSESRIREAAALPQVESLVTACPKDIAMFEDAVKTTGLEKTITIKDISQLVWEAMTPRQAGG